MIRLNICMTLFILAIVYSCSRNKNNDPVTMEWTKVVNTLKPVNYCQIDSLSNGYILAYSHPIAIGGGFRIIKFKTLTENNLENKFLFKSNNNTTQFLTLKGNDIGFVSHEFKNNIIRSKIFLSHNLGETWNEIETPLEGGVRNFCLLEEFLFVEGSFKGSGRIFKSSDSGHSWSNIETLENGFKSFYLLGANNNKILCKGSKSFNEKDSWLLLFDPENNSIKEILDFDDNYYLKPISKDENLHCIIDGNRLKVYSLKNEEMTLHEKFRLPSSISWVENIYLSFDYCIITAREEDLKGKTLSWISCDKGTNWYNFEHNQELRLIDNSFGKLFMIGIDNEILMRK